MIDKSALKFALDNRLNVLFIGKAGVGKTGVVKQVFEEAGLKWKYFSVATMDPWVDLIGIPKEKTDKVSKETYLDLVRPREFANDEVEAIFFDEFNRGAKKVKNAVMELIQFGSINGHKFKNLKVIWAAINPEGEQEDGSHYDVEPLDPAQQDRFHLQINVDYKPDPTYFGAKYPRLATNALKWWNNLDEQRRNMVSPRRLDYALECLSKGGGDVIRFMFPRQINVDEFFAMVQAEKTVEEILEDLFEKKDKKAAKKFFSDENKLTIALGVLNERSDNTAWLKFFVPLIPEEKLAVAVSHEPSMADRFHKLQAAIFVEIIEQNNDEFRDLLRPAILNGTIKIKSDDKNALKNLLLGDK